MVRENGGAVNVGRVGGLAKRPYGCPAKRLTSMTARSWIPSPIFTPSSFQHSTLNV